MTDQKRWTEDQLVLLSKMGNHAAQESLIELHMAGIISQVRKTLIRFPLADPENLLQIGRMTLLRVAEKYSWEKGCKFFSYATWWLKQMMERDAHADRLMKFPISCRKRDEEKVTRAKSIASLSNFPRDFIADASSPQGTFGEGPVDCTVEELDQQQVAMLLVDALEDREKLVVEMTVCGESTLGECGKKLGVSKERVRQLRNKALEQLREGMGVTA